MRQFAQELPSFGLQELIDEFAGICESVKNKSICFTFFQMGSLYARNLRKPQISEAWKRVESVYLYIILTVGSLKDLIFVGNETCVVNWVLLEHMGLCSPICACPPWRRSICMCLLNWDIALSSARWNDGFSGNYAPFLWGISRHSLAVMVAQGTGRRSSEA